MGKRTSRTPTGASLPAPKSTPWKEWADPRKAGKVVTRGELIGVVNLALNQYRAKHTLFGRIKAWWNREREQVKQELSEIGQAVRGPRDDNREAE